MTMVTATTEREFMRRQLNRPVPRFLARMGCEVARRLATRQLRQGLRATPDWVLHDIGVERREIEAIALRIIAGRLPPSRAVRRGQR